MNLKKSIAIGFAAMALFVSFGCGSSGKQGGSGSPANVSTQQEKPIDEATIKKLAKQMTSPKIEDRKDAFPIENHPAAAILKTPLKDDSNSFMNFISQPLKIDNLSVSDIKQSGEYASARASFTGDNNQQINALWTFRKLNGKWVFYMSEIKTSKPLKISGYDGAQLEAAANIGYTYNNEPVIVFDVRSKDTINYLALSQSVLVTDSGEFPIQNTATCSTDPTVLWEITSAQPFRFILPFKGATGKPKAIRFLSFNELDSLGLPINPMTNDEMTFTLSE